MANLNIELATVNNELLVLSLLDGSEECYLIKTELKGTGTIGPFCDRCIKILEKQKKYKLIEAIKGLKKNSEEAHEFMERVNRLL